MSFDIKYALLYQIRHFYILITPLANIEKMNKGSLRSKKSNAEGSNGGPPSHCGKFPYQKLYYGVLIWDES